LIARRAAVLVALAALLLPSVASAAPKPKTNLATIEGEVMCTICGTLLELADSPQANQERDFIRAKIAKGETEQQIKDDLVAQYGPRVLALPPASGFDLSAYLVPVIAFVVAAVSIGVGVRRWRRNSSDDDPPQALEPAQSDRLDADIARYDL
jgi:cytochrome c-type biogenesis protein CcmH